MKASLGWRMFGGMPQGAGPRPNTRRRGPGRNPDAFMSGTGRKIRDAPPRRPIGWPNKRGRAMAGRFAYGDIIQALMGGIARCSSLSACCPLPKRFN